MLILKRAHTSRPLVEQRRLRRACGWRRSREHHESGRAVPVGVSWMWTLAFDHHEDRTPTHGYAATREESKSRDAVGSRDAEVCYPFGWKRGRHWQ
jgi:hypothetical protein